MGSSAAVVASFSAQIGPLFLALETATGRAGDWKILLSMQFLGWQCLPLPVCAHHVGRMMGSRWQGRTAQLGLAWSKIQGVGRRRG